MVQRLAHRPAEGGITASSANTARTRATARSPNALQCAPCATELHTWNGLNGKFYVMRYIITIKIRFGSDLEVTLVCFAAGDSPDRSLRAAAPTQFPVRKCTGPIRRRPSVTWLWPSEPLSVL